MAPATARPTTRRVEVHELYFTVQPAPVNKRFGGFLPKLFKAAPRLPSMSLTGRHNARVDVALHDAYLKDQADNVNGLFARIVKEPISGQLADEVSKAAFQAKDAGGLATPDLAVTSLTRELGPVAGTPLKAARNEFDAGDFFGAMKDSARLFGTFSLVGLIKSATAAAGAPKLEINPEAGPPLAVVGTLDWQPEVKDARRRATSCGFAPARVAQMQRFASPPASSRSSILRTRRRRRSMAP